MEDEHAIARYRRWYRILLRLYSRSYRQRFGESMEQTFNDLCRERARAGAGLGRFVLWAFLETSAGILREHTRFLMMQKKILRIAFGTACVLLVPLMGKLCMGWNWGAFDFVILGAMLFFTGVVFDVVASKGSTTAYRVAVGIACATGFVLVFINAAVGVIGDGPVNLLYFGVLAVGFVGALIAQFQPRGMALALLATAVAQMLVPVIALVIWKTGGQVLLVDPQSPHSAFHPGVAQVFGLNAVFAVLWLTSALLFRRAAGPGSNAPRDETRRSAIREGLAG